jgi:rfaE bifunctional protein nucleotidyltransferase chain/domain
MLLEQAKRLGHKLIVGINTDKSVKALKGDGRPINVEKDRARIIAALQSVDLVVFINDVRIGEFLDVIKPNVWAKGGDYTLATLDQGEVKIAHRIGARIKLIPPVQGASTTSTIRQVKGTKLSQSTP